MKKIFINHYSLFLLIALCAVSCRDLGDDLTSYGQNDYHAFADAEKSFAGQFKAVWMAMNENYGIWDYEEQLGLNWDDVYTEFLPRFEALDDTTANKAKVTDEELKDLYSQFIDSLHDGHFELQIKNLHTGHRFLLTPSETRIRRERGDLAKAESANITDIARYATYPSANQYYAGGYDAASSVLVLAEALDTLCQRFNRAANNYIALVDNAGGPNETNDSIYTMVKKMQKMAVYILSQIPQAKTSMSRMKSLVAAYNVMVDMYGVIASQLGIKMPLIEEGMTKDELKNITTAVFNDGIVYLRIGGFGLTRYLENKAPGDTTGLTYYYYRAVNRVWQNWFDTIQALHADGELGGVIIDVRNNGGGYLNDYQYVIGALLPSGGYESHYLRVKQGTARLDFAPLVPFVMQTYPEEHAVITEQPIVILANSLSVSMAELTTWGVQSRPNGYFIGTRTWGGLSGLYDDPAAYSQTYSGSFGVCNETSFYAYLPRFVSLFGQDKKILEGIGLTPDMEVQLDVQNWQTYQRDNQLEAAIDYIRNR